MSTIGLATVGTRVAMILASIQAPKLPAADARRRTPAKNRPIGAFWRALAVACALMVVGGGITGPSLGNERSEQMLARHARSAQDGRANRNIENKDGKCGLQTTGSSWPEFRSTANRDGLYLGNSPIAPPSAQDLTPIWKAPTGGAIFSSPAVVNGIAYVGSLDGVLHAFSASTGTPLWATPVPAVPGGPMSSPAVANGVVYIGGADFRVHAFDATAGTPIWTAGTAVTGGPIISSPSIFNAIVYIGSDDKKIYAFDASSGALVWSFATGGMVRSSPAMANGVVYVASLDGNVYALDANTGSLVWKRALGAIPESSPAVANGLVYIGAEESLFALSAANGARVWRAATGQGPSFASSPAVFSDRVVIGANPGVNANTLFSFEAIHGTPIWSANVGGAVVSSPAIVNGVVLIGSDDGDLHAFDPNKGTELWSTQTGGAVRSSPAVTDDMVYVGSSDHALYAYAATSDWPMFHHSPTLSGVNAAETKISPSNVGTLVAAWTWTACPTCFVEDPAVANGVVYAGLHIVGVCDECLAAFDAETGSQLWQTALPLVPTGETNAAPSVWDGRVYVSSNRHLYAFDAASGAQLWVTPDFGAVLGPPIVQNGLVYAADSIQGSNTGLHARNPFTGAAVWDALIPNVAPGAAPAVANKRAYVGGFPPSTNKLFAYDAVTGTLLPSWPVAGGADRSAAVADGIVYWGDKSGAISAYDAISGTNLWTAHTAAALIQGSSPAVANRVLYVGASNKVFAFDVSSGSPQWATAVSGTINVSSPAVANGVVFIGSDTSTAGTVQALDAVSGAVLWSASLPSSEGSSSPAVARGMVYIGGSSGLHAYRLP